MIRKYLKLAISLGITVVVLWLAFRGADMGKLWQALRGVNYIWAIPFMVVTIVSMYFRTLRWKYLLQPVVDVPANKLFPPIMICFTLNSILPGRAGEFARAYLVAKDHRAPFSASFATVLVERIADGLALLAFFVLILAFVPLGQGAVEWQGYTLNAETLQQLSKKMLVICGVLLTGTLLMLWEPFHRLVTGILNAMPLIPAKIKGGLTKFIDSFVQGFHSLRSFRIVFWVIVHTATVWITVGWSLQLMSYGFPELKMSFVQGMATSIIICIAILIPAAPGYWGLYEMGAVLALLILGVVPVDAQGRPLPNGQELALSYALVAHFVQMIPIVALGLYFMWRRQVHLSDITAAESAGPEEINTDAPPAEQCAKAEASKPELETAAAR